MNVLQSTQSRLILIDGNAIMHRAYHAMPALTTQKGEPIGAVYGLVSMILRIVQDLKPSHIAVCFDRKEPTFRKEMFEDYQSHRPETDKDLASQFPKAKKVFENFNIPIYEKAGFEADDLIGTLAVRTVSAPSRKSQTTNRNIDEVVIVTGDKDILQLVNDKVSVYLPNRGVVDGNLYGEEEVIIKMGITPEQIVDYKALVGDPSDNYPGVYGIGPKTAEKLLAEYKNFDEIYKNIDKIDANVAKKLKEGRENGLLSRKLAKIVTDVDFEHEIDQAAAWQLGNPRALELFDEFGFRTLKKRVKYISEQLEKDRQTSLF